MSTLHHRGTTGKTKKRKKEQLPKSSKIVIIGGGLGGLSTALSLKHAGFSNVHIYERDMNPTNEQGEQGKKRREGYGLTLTYNPKGPLAKLGILEELAQRDTPSRSHYVFSSDGSIMGYFGNAFIPDRGHGQRGNLRVPRHVVRDIMIKKLNENKDDNISVMINWGKRLERIESHSSELNGNQKVKIWFNDGGYVDNIHLLIGADGIRSIVRDQIVSKFMPSTPPLQYMKVFLILGISSLDHPLLAQRGFYTLDGIHRLFIMPFEDNDCSFRDVSYNGKSRRTMWQLTFYLENEEEAKILSNRDENFLLDEVKRRVKNWHEPVLDIVTNTEKGSVWGTALMDLPAVLRIHHKSHHEQSLPFVLIGDAIHPMSPFKGQGANQALADGPALTDWLLKSNLSSALVGFEREMHSRTRPKVLASREAAQFLHSNDVIDCNKCEQNIAGVKKEFLTLVIKTLKKHGIGANCSGKLDVEVNKIINRLNAGVETNLQSTQKKAQFLNGDALNTVHQQALRYAEEGDTFCLRNLSIQYSCSAIKVARDNESGRSCLFLSAIRGHFHTTKWLLEEAGMLEMNHDEESHNNLNHELMIDENGQNPLHAAVVSGNTSIVGAIVKKCKEIEFAGWGIMKDKTGATPLMLLDRLHFDETKKKRVDETSNNIVWRE